MKIMVTALLFLAFVNAGAQTENTIRNYYQEINRKIAESKSQGFEGPLYNNQWTTNKTGRSWPAVARYEETTNFWYDDPPDHLSASDRNPKIVLVKVTIDRKAADFASAEEFLFQNGHLVFYYTLETEEGKSWETRLYFNPAGKAFKTSFKVNGKELSPREMNSKEYSDDKPDAARTLISAKKYQDLFLKSML